MSLPETTSVAAATTLATLSTAPANSTDIETRRALLVTLLDRALTADDIDDVEGVELARLFYATSHGTELESMYTYALTTPRFKQWALAEARYRFATRLDDAIARDDKDATHTLLAQCMAFTDNKTELRTKLALRALQTNAMRAWSAIVDPPATLAVVGDIGAEYVRVALSTPDETIVQHACALLGDAIRTGEMSVEAAIVVMNRATTTYTNKFEQSAIISACNDMLWTLVGLLLNERNADDDDDSDTDDEEEEKVVPVKRKRTLAAERTNNVAELCAAIKDTFVIAPQARMTPKQLVAALTRKYPTVLAYTTMPTIAIGKAIVRVFPASTVRIIEKDDSRYYRLTAH